MIFAPIALFIYNRPEHTRKTLEALASNTISQESDLFIFADGAKENATPEQRMAIENTRKIAYSKKWCKTVTVIESQKNKGLAASIISGVGDVINKYGKVIVLEDDIVTGKYFLDYMNTALEKYAGIKQVWHVTGWREPIAKSKKGRSYFYPTMDCWGWGTWSDRWQYFVKDTNFYKGIFTDKMKFHFNIEGSEPGMWGQIEANDCGKINTWAIFWYATLFTHGGLCLAPTLSLVRNIGLDNSGIHCGSSPMQQITHDIDIKIIYFPSKIKIDKAEYKKNIAFYNKMYHRNLAKRIVERIKRMLKECTLTKNIYYHLKNIYRGEHHDR